MLFLHDLLIQTFASILILFSSIRIDRGLDEVFFVIASTELCALGIKTTLESLQSLQIGRNMTESIESRFVIVKLCPTKLPQREFESAKGTSQTI